jgi:transcriptional regulator with XRE-family HTH domain
MSSPFSVLVTIPALEWMRSTLTELDMPATKRRPSQEMFGQRLARLRKARGLTQRALSVASGVSQRMIAYYETHEATPPGHLLPGVAKALGVSLEELLGAKRLPSEPPVVNVRLWKRVQKIEQLPPAARKAVLRVLDAYLAQYTDDDLRSAG